MDSSAPCDGGHECEQRNDNNHASRHRSLMQSTRDLPRSRCTKASKPRARGVEDQRRGRAVKFSSAPDVRYTWTRGLRSSPTRPPSLLFARALGHTASIGHAIRRLQPLRHRQTGRRSHRRPVYLPLALPQLCRLGQRLLLRRQSRQHCMVLGGAPISESRAARYGGFCVEALPRAACNARRCAGSVRGGEIVVRRRHARFGHRVPAHSARVRAAALA